jgi:hypothetical protein
MTPAPSVTPERLMQMAWGYAAPLMIEAAVKARLFASSSRTTAARARRCR